MATKRYSFSCKFCDQRMFIEVPEGIHHSYQVTVAFKTTMDQHLLQHVEEMTEIPNARY